MPAEHPQPQLVPRFQKLPPNLSSSGCFKDTWLLKSSDRDSLTRQASACRAGEPVPRVRVAWACPPTHGWVLHNPAGDWLLNTGFLWKANGLGKDRGRPQSTWVLWERLLLKTGPMTGKGQDFFLFFRSVFSQFLTGRQESGQRRAVRDRD